MKQSMHPYPVDCLITPDDCEQLISEYSERIQPLKMKLIGLKLRFDVRMKKAENESSQITEIETNIRKIQESPDSLSEFSQKSIQKLKEKTNHIHSICYGIEVWEARMEILNTEIDIQEITDILQQLKSRKKVLIALSKKRAIR